MEVLNQLKKIDAGSFGCTNDKEKIMKQLDSLQFNANVGNNE